jgi:hypothetical protein
MSTDICFYDVRLLTFLPLSADGCFNVHIGNTDYTSYLSEIHPQMPELHAAYVPTDYRCLLRFLLQPVIWQQKALEIPFNGDYLVIR